MRTFTIICYHVVGIFTIGTEKVLLFATDFSAVSFDSGDTFSNLAVFSLSFSSAGKEQFLTGIF